MVWLDKDDRLRVGNEIIATHPAVWNATTEEHDMPEDEYEQMLLQHVKKKQMHACREPMTAGCRSNGTCRYA